MGDNYTFLHEFMEFIMFFFYILPHVVQEILCLFVQEQNETNINKTHLINITGYNGQRIKSQMTYYSELEKH